MQSLDGPKFGRFFPAVLTLGASLGGCIGYVIGEVLSNKIQNVAQEKLASEDKQDTLKTVSLFTGIALGLGATNLACWGKIDRRSVGLTAYLSSLILLPPCLRLIESQFIHLIGLGHLFEYGPNERPQRNLTYRKSGKGCQFAPFAKKKSE